MVCEITGCNYGVYARVNMEGGKLASCADHLVEVLDTSKYLTKSGALKTISSNGAGYAKTFRESPTKWIREISVKG